MKDLKNIDLMGFFQQDAQIIIQARDKALKLHPTNLRSCGNEVEQSLRNFLSARIPDKYRIGQGHIIDSNHLVSPQIDILITESSTLPILIKTADSTEYYPCESIYAIGEVKTTYSKRGKPIEKFCDMFHSIKTEMKRETVINTAFGGELSGDTLLNHTFLGCPNKTLNPLYSFIVFVNTGDFKWDTFKSIVEKFDNEYLPNLIVFLDSGIVFNGSMIDGKLNLYRYPEYLETKSNWMFTTSSDLSIASGVHLTFLYYDLLSHLSSCYLEHPNYMSYFRDYFRFSLTKTKYNN